MKASKKLSEDDGITWKMMGFGDRNWMHFFFDVLSFLHEFWGYSNTLLPDSFKKLLKCDGSVENTTQHQRGSHQPKS